MPVDLTKKRVPPVGLIQVKNADGSYMTDDQGRPAFARMHSPSSKIWESAHAARRRKGLKRVRENGGRIEAMADSPEDALEFLLDITEEFINLEVPLPDGQSGAKAIVRAIYTDPELGYIRDHLDEDAKDWGAFLPLSASSSISGSDSSHG